MPRVWLTRRDGSQEPVDARTGRSLMLNIRKPGQIQAICGGCASCGTCHVYIAEDWVERLPPIQPEEETILALSDWREPNSRLSCQIKVTDDLDGLCVTVAPED
ncbi:2Fe-2S iron-sulfur cluster-binding protein [Sphingomonas sp. SM33]|uniref:2Fe-2S iron-sulfur cluster-binding protein n=1 Tax=Sphingomonas telluris TaxID=2907998 RepID=A0ABS9VPQ3_9SPHN|nr:2Fe-2S iron-sulfur cluster-binding protein [Sphingomonas telluris]MCH8616494.1 2Fe-2S iron-sulfur cluster-binding protein [Sphingomonas telluris]